jgi:hypothetical protein
MAEEATISLHDAGQRLTVLHPSTEKVACGKLLSLLKSGQIKAGFQFPGRRGAVTWIAIPTHYWVTVSGDKFKVIRNLKNKPKSGAFKVRLGQFAKEVVAQVNEAPSDEQATSDIWEAVLDATSRAYEVAITEAEWNAYEKENPPSELLQAKRENRGRDEKKGWRQVLVIIGAYIVKHYETSREKIKAEEASKKIHEIAKAEVIFEMPAESTIKDELLKILNKAESISIN